jgi:hypothetical protein
MEGDKGVGQGSEDFRWEMVVEVGSEHEAADLA